MRAAGVTTGYALPSPESFPAQHCSTPHTRTAAPYMPRACHRPSPFLRDEQAHDVWRSQLAAYARRVPHSHRWGDDLVYVRQCVPMFYSPLRSTPLPETSYHPELTTHPRPLSDVMPCFNFKLQRSTSTLPHAAPTLSALTGTCDPTDGACPLEIAFSTKCRSFFQRHRHLLHLQVSAPTSSFTLSPPVSR